MSQHTPGPWRVENRGGMTGRLVEAGEHLLVATVNTTSDAEGNRAANARLIASAPELLAALKDIEDISECYCGTTHDEGRCLTCRARDAIAKATGEERK